jgi:hypothetical protein
MTLNEWVAGERAADRDIGPAWVRAYLKAHGSVDSDPATALKRRQAFDIEQVLLRRFPPQQEAAAFGFVLDVARWLNRRKPAAEEVGPLGEACGWLDSEAAQALLELIT